MCAVASVRAIACVHGPYVCLVDLVNATTFPPELVDAYVATTRSEPRLVRTASLLPSATFGMQIEPMTATQATPSGYVLRAPLDRGSARSSIAASAPGYAGARSPRTRGPS